MSASGRRNKSARVAEARDLLSGRSARPGLTASAGAVPLDTETESLRCPHCGLPFRVTAGVRFGSHQPDGGFGTHIKRCDTANDFEREFYVAKRRWPRSFEKTLGRTGRKR